MMDKEQKKMPDHAGNMAVPLDVQVRLAESKRKLASSDTNSESVVALLGSKPTKALSLFRKLKKNA